MRLAAAVGAVVVSVAGCGVFSGHRHTTDDDPRELSHPERIEQVAWDWEAPEGVRIVATVAVPVGVVVVLDDGFVALAGDTGEEVWHYRVGEDARAAYASRQGDYLAMEIEDPEDGAMLVELAPSTGEVLKQAAIEETDDERGINGAFGRNVSDGVLILRDPFDDPALEGRSLETGEALWVREDPPECTKVDGPNTDTVASAVLGEVVLEGFSCTGGEDDDGAGLIGRDLYTGEELWRFEEVLGPSVPGLGVLHRRYDPLTDRHLAMRTVNGLTRVFDVVSGELLGEWEEEVIGVLEDGSVALESAKHNQYRRLDPSGELLTALSIPRGVDRSVYPVVVEDGVVSHGRSTLEPGIRVWFQSWEWENDGEPVVIDVDDERLDDPEAAISATAVPGSVLLRYSEDGPEAKEILFGLT
ncbi:PQQ-binding-like beta-propeller repeat protein [Thermobifida halotolerans]|uniref:PQQ-binding-like beta-propeller repeat protein n=1 Tax=Thermobifida halotolerans TaxID=483545 RepID=A0A399G0S4_9ACTN|nr:PQQ-binding-like beta-propeller repeat protein [Thermobifida halotolerans]UOE18498.1 PQQ-binding-like beta-propeller repeat protein [Thermobifida halotolerans]